MKNDQGNGTAGPNEFRGPIGISSAGRAATANHGQTKALRRLTTAGLVFSARQVDLACDRFFASRGMPTGWGGGQR